MKYGWLLLSLLVAHTASAEYVRSRIGRHGGSDQTSGPYTTGQRYYSQSHYQGQHLQGASAYENRWDVGRAYRVDAYGRPLAEGSLRSAGDAQRVYLHTNNPVTLQSIEEREAEIQRRHRYYLDASQQSFEVITRRTMENRILENNPSPRNLERQEANDQFIRIFDRLHKLETNLHRDEIRGTAPGLPPVR